METFLLLGNPENGMDIDNYKKVLDAIARNDNGGDEWTMRDSPKAVTSRSQIGDQVVLYKSGQTKSGLIGFGLRRPGRARLGINNRPEYPVRFYNLKSLDQEPYLSRSQLQEAGFWQPQNFLYSGQPLDVRLLTALEECCEKELGVSLQTLCSSRHPASSFRAGPDSYCDDQEDEAELKSLESAGLRETDRTQLIQSRRGQGLFRARVALLESCCRVTRVNDQGYLVASHIKPWKVSDNRERLDGSNGFLLSPHVDWLFDRGCITFHSNGSLAASPFLPLSILGAWGIDAGLSVGSFTDEQERYLCYHREFVFARRAIALDVGRDGVMLQAGC